jgi:hypothetical protein
MNVLRCASDQMERVDVGKEEGSAEGRRGASTPTPVLSARCCGHAVFYFPDCEGDRYGDNVPFAADIRAGKGLDGAVRRCLQEWSH